MSIANKLVEAVSCVCPNCGSVVQPDRNLLCPNCNENIDNEILDIVWKDGSDNILIFNDTDQSVNKANINHIAKGHRPIGDNALVVGISKDFFDALVPDSHGRTSADSPYGKVLPQQPEDIQAALLVLKQNAVRYRDSSYKNKIAKLLDESCYTDFAEEFENYKNLWEDSTVGVLPDNKDPFAELPSDVRDFANKRKAEVDKANIGINPVLRTFGRKTYNLADTNELFAWWQANLEFQMKRYPDKYAGYRGRTNDYKLHTTIANNLINRLKADGITNEKIFKELQNMAKGNSWVASYRDDIFNKAKAKMYDVAEVYLGDSIKTVSWTDLTAIVEKTTDSLLVELKSLT